jgi:hypothetical protein
MKTLDHDSELGHSILETNDGKYFIKWGGNEDN